MTKRAKGGVGHDVRKPSRAAGGVGKRRAPPFDADGAEAGRALSYICWHFQHAPTNTT